MKKILRLIFLLPPALLMIMAGCKEDNLPGKLPDIRVTPKPVRGLTTDVFEISVEPVGSGSYKTTLFYRWDWNQDGSWDMPFTAGNLFKHRFLQAGNYTVSLEYSDGKKQVRTEKMTLLVEQGYSAPQPAFTISPANGNILTEFRFDAGLSRDDEDSPDQLKFRWDFRGDGHWPDEYSKSPVAVHQYSSSGIYYPKVEVRDPSGRSATVSGQLTVNLIDTLIVACFTISDTLIRVKDTVLLDASPSYHSKYPAHHLLYSWYLPDRLEWTVPDDIKTRTLIAHQSGPAAVSLKVIDKETGLYNQVTNEFFIAGENLPPKAKISVGSVYGNVLTQFFLDSWSSSDDSQSPGELDVRWDFNGDGEYDTPYSKEKTLFHQYEQPGEYFVVLQVKDERGLTSSDKARILVSGNTNTTGYMRDQRDGTYYGTVQIGSQWWMSQNLNFTIPGKDVEGIAQWICLMDQQRFCDQVGKLYRIEAVVKNRTDAEYVAVCPGGWRLPSQEDWETLINAIGGDQNGNELRYGGKFDFNAWDLGFAEYRFIREPFTGAITDTVFDFRETYKGVWFFSSTERYDPIKIDNVWMLTIDRASGDIWTGYGLSRNYMPVRCLKED